MRLKVPKELLLLNAVTVLFVLAITLLPSSTLRFILGVPFLLFAPGYALIAALFPRKKQIDTEVLLRDSILRALLRHQSGVRLKKAPLSGG